MRGSLPFQIRTLLIWLGPLLWLACSPPERRTIDLFQALPTAVHEVSDWPRGSLGDPRLRPFCSGPWGEAVGDAERESLPGAPFLRFRLEQVLPLSLELSGRTAQGHHDVELRLNGRTLETLALGPLARQHRLVLPREALRQGENQLVLASSQVSLWGQVRLQPSAWQHIPAPTDWDASGRVRLPFWWPLHLSLQLDGSRRVLEAQVEPWKETGAAEGPSRLWVRVRSEQPLYDRNEWVPAGQPLHWELPSDLREVSLTLMAEPLEPPWPGQRGLELRLPAPSPVEPTLTTAERHPEPPRTTTPTPSPEVVPPVLIYVIDTLRADHLSCYGYARRTSPHLDALARDGIRFLDVTAQSSWTKASTATLLTGLLPQQHGALDYGDRLPPEIETLGERLQDSHRPVAFTTNGFASNAFDLLQGWEETHLALAPSLEVHQAVVRWLDDGPKDRPFFLYIHTIDPHLPYQPPTRFQQWSTPSAGVLHRDMKALVQNFDSRKLQKAIDLYDAEIASNDHSLGLLIQELKDRGLYDAALIMVTSDHGEELFEHGGYGHGQTLYQEALRIPWILKLPRQQRAGTEVHGAWQHLDMAPTLLYHLGREVPDVMRGFAYGSAPELPTRDILTHLFLGPDAEQFQKKKNLVFSLQGLRQEDKIYIECRAHTHRDLPHQALFDLSSDPSQQRDLSEARGVLRGQMRRRLTERSSEWSRAAAPATPAPDTERALRSLQYLR